MRRQRRRFSERARITVYYLKDRAVVATMDPKENLHDPSTIADALDGLYFKRWARYGRINLVWDQLQLIKDHG